MLLPAELFDGLKQVRAPMEAEAVEAELTGGGEDRWQIHANSPSVLYNTHYTTAKTVLSTTGKFVDFFVFCRELQILLAIITEV